MRVSIGKLALEMRSREQSRVNVYVMMLAIILPQVRGCVRVLPSVCNKGWLC